MDARHFDSLTRALSERGPRRGLLGLLAALPVLGGLFALLDLDEVAAKGRRKRRKKAHKHGKGRRRKHHKKCNAESKGKTCQGKCGPVKNTCKKTVDCGSCACEPACDVCFTCQEGPNTLGECVIDPAQQGQTCGDPGQVCQSDGSCACDTTTCSNPAPVCADGTCMVCSASDPCPEGCCASDGSCQPGNSVGACGDPGQACAVCEALEECSAGTCVALPCGAGGVCRVFVTSTTYTGNLDGLSGGDAKCQARSTAAGLSGTYKAWLSDATTTASARLVHSTGPYQLLDGTPIANNWSDLTDMTLSHAIDRTEENLPADPTTINVWTGTYADGTYTGQSCSDWMTGTSETGDSGWITRTDEFWSWVNRLNCGANFRLYCIQQS